MYWIFLNSFGSACLIQKRKYFHWIGFVPIGNGLLVLAVKVYKAVRIYL